ncbi:Toxin RelK [Limihaloglobus sulfuriphilus]|uniref:Putative mRNA interferase YoeB n=1 Tax=Limihaloglobus sulfuriphilus TaxID=1851148 RepID=A0A1Q2MAW8_9BACT|nr:Txe/YoeB family addiction module toxin [Limihaloglobus sulfuriphilus]AQQ69875.1 Toxin RelK [Limihaloglobus sulfuriphilus]
MVGWKVVFTSRARKDSRKLSSSGFRSNAEKLLDILEHDPFQSPPPYEKLVGNLTGCYSRRINIQHRLVYSINEEERVVKILRMWSHYE